MDYNIDYTEDAVNDIKKYKKFGNKILLNKINNLLNEIRINPRMGTGKPERLKHYKDLEVWSRRLDYMHRLVYEIQEDTKTVNILSAWGHYKAK